MSSWKSPFFKGCLLKSHRLKGYLLAMVAALFVCLPLLGCSGGGDGMPPERTSEEIEKSRLKQLRDSEEEAAQG